MQIALYTSSLLCKKGPGLPAFQCMFGMPCLKCKPNLNNTPSFSSSPLHASISNLVTNIPSSIVSSTINLLLLIPWIRPTPWLPVCSHREGIGHYDSFYLQYNNPLKIRTGQVHIFWTPYKNAIPVFWRNLNNGLYYCLPWRYSQSHKSEMEVQFLKTFIIISPKVTTESA